MSTQCSQLLPQVCGVLVDERQLINDTSCYEKLLDWFKSLLNTVPVTQLLEDNPCIIQVFQHVLNVGELDPNLLSFALRLAGIFAGHEVGYKYLQREDIAHNMFGKYTSDLWKDASVRIAWIQGLLSMVQHKQAVSFLSKSVLDVIFNLQMDSSLYVASASNQLVAHIFLSYMKMDLENTECNCVSDWPESAQTIITYLEKSLKSGISFLVSQSIKTLTAVYKGCSNGLAAVLWSHISVLINSLLNQKSVHGSDHLEDLFLCAARFPSISNSESDLWILVALALKSLNPFHSGSLALGILRLQHCPQSVCLQAVCVLLHPFDFILKSSNYHNGHTGLLDELVTDPVEVEKLLITKSSCVSLLCQYLCHLHQLCNMSLMSCVITVLEFCIGHTSGFSARSTLCRNLIGCLRVQRSALDALGALSSCPVLKKSLQASLSWLRSSSATTDSEYWPLTSTFLQDLCPVLKKRLCSPSWEIRDSTLEFLTLLIDSFKECTVFINIVTTSGIPLIVLDLLKDPESYVRASAVSCLGHLLNICPSSEVLQTNTEDIVLRFLDMLSRDTEGFPRRAIMRVFTDWLEQGHMQELKDFEGLFSRILEVTSSDLDWEVKVNALTFAEVFIRQTHDMCNVPSYPRNVNLPSNKTTDSMTEVMQKWNRVGLFDFLFNSLCDCDRPVALRSCNILCSLKTTLPTGELPTGELPTESKPLELYNTEWLESTMKDRSFHVYTNSNGLAQDVWWVADILNKVDLQSLKDYLSKSSGHIHETPQSLLHDIKASLWCLEEHDADCY
ncbi:hypothetical protein GDO86_017309 [Hymenochirus boettgeri]|uniref:BRCA1-associated ATM activator 1 n=1 Tax=Hymenochirus boettgeri TaxID=247094 RepID=A0A8T2IJN8_9PIPI|nr:hypothetical protein GDO86_017309 [Hymenochirus boettgeri]